eukprot:Awhi_evm2s10335
MISTCEANGFTIPNGWRVAVWGPREERLLNLYHWSTPCLIFDGGINKGPSGEPSEDCINLQLKVFYEGSQVKVEYNAEAFCPSRVLLVSIEDS